VATAGVDFFRIDRSGPTRRLLSIAGVLVTVGATAIGAHLVHRISPELGHVVSLAGGVTVVAGLILGFGAMAMLVFENVYLLLREDGVLCHDNGKETTIPWDDLERVVIEEREGFVVFERTGGARIRWFAGKTARHLAAKIEEAKRKALLGLLRTGA
jgi:hypothetical protein